MSYPINYPTPQGANIQIIYAGSPSTTSQEWFKPQGASFVWFTLIGAGGIGTSTTGGGSGAVTNFMCPAFLIPDSLIVSAGISGSTNTQIRYQQKNNAGYQLLVATSGSGSTAGTAMTANYFTAMGFFQSIAGMSGSASDIATPSSTTFLSGGGNSGVIVGNYGYRTGGSNESGFFQMQPIIVGTGSSGLSSITLRGGIGCGGPAATTGTGGNGMVVIITW